MRRRSVLLGAAAGAVAPLLAAAPALADRGAPPPPVPGRPPGGTRPPKNSPGNLAARLHTLPTGTEQVVIVHGPGGSDTTATVETFAMSRTGWMAISAPLPARIGRTGFRDSRTEGDGSTPTGVYTIDPTMYGIAADPGVGYAYHRLVENDWWNENSASTGYNSFHHGADPGGGSEALWTISPQYTHFAVITYNMPPTVARPVPNKGSGIFLHQFSPGAGPTAGCVSLAHDHLVGVLRWLDPARNPRIVLSPTANLSRY